MAAGNLGEESRIPEKFQAIRETTKSRKDFVTGVYSLSYGELFTRIDQTAALFKKIGLDVGDRAVIACRNDLETAILYFAMLRSGVTAVIMDPNASTSETLVLLAAADPKVIFMDDKMASDAIEAGGDTDVQLFRMRADVGKPERTKFGLLRRKKAEAAPDADSYPAVAKDLEPLTEPLGPISAETSALILFTSGTTSQPKGVELTHKNLAAQYETFARQYEIDSDCRIHNHLALHHTDGVTQGPALALFTGATWVRPGGLTMQSLPAIMDGIYQERATHVVTVPTVLAMMLRLPSDYDDSFDLAEFRHVLSTAGYLDESIWTTFEDRFRVTVVNSYGLTETVSEALYCGPDPQTRKMGTKGRPIDCEACIFDEAGEQVGVGEVGELALRGDNVMKGYFRNPEATSDVMRDGWFLTGDLAAIDQDGFFSIVGRKKNVIIKAGTNVYPEDVTSCISNMSGVTDVATFGLEDKLLGESVVSCIVVDGSSQITPEAVTEYCRKNLAREKVPDRIFILDSLPRGPAGKAIIHELKAIAKRLYDADIQTADGSTESQVLSIASSVFRVPLDDLSSGSNEKTIEGWDSLSHLEFIMALEKNFSVNLGPRDVMNIVKLADAVDVLREKGADVHA